MHRAYHHKGEKAFSPIAGATATTGRLANNPIPILPMGNQTGGDKHRFDVHPGEREGSAGLQNDIHHGEEGGQPGNNFCTDSGTVFL